MILTCQKCSHTYRFAPSKRVNPCPNCASIEDTGFSLKEIAQQKAKEWSERSRLKSLAKQALKPPKTYVIKNRSAKGAKQEREVKATKKKLKDEAADGQGFVECAGCGNFFSGLEGSHKVQLSKSSELASEERNIRLLCRKCHDKWGEGSVIEMLELKCLVEDLRYLFEHDTDRFWKIFYRFVDEYNARPTPKLNRIISKLETFEQ